MWSRILNGLFRAKQPIDDEPEAIATDAGEAASKAMSLS
jgi:hypothetical protein